jgi:hypothetical protein
MEVSMTSIGFSEEACFPRVQSRMAGKEKIGIRNNNEFFAEHPATACSTLREGRKPATILRSPTRYSSN